MPFRVTDVTGATVPSTLISAILFSTVKLKRPEEVYNFIRDRVRINTIQHPFQLEKKLAYELANIV